VPVRWHEDKPYNANWVPKYSQPTKEARLKAFKKDVKAAWRAESLKSGKASQRLRGIAWKTVTSELMASGQKFGRAEARKALLTATGLFCVKIVAARLKASTAEKAEMEQAMQQKEKALADIEDAKKVQAEKSAAAEKAFSVTEMEWVQKTSALQAQFAKVEANLAQKLADADAQYAEKTAALEADVKDLEKRKAAAEKALDALRSKLG
jgi:hypothetical protein